MRRVFTFERDPSSQHSTIAHTITLSKPRLLQWSNWDKGKPYLVAAEEQIVILEVVEQYFSEIASFQMWMRARLEQEHAEAMRIHVGLRRLLDEKASQNTPIDPPLTR